MKGLRSVASTSAAAIVATALPTAFAISSSSSSSSSKSIDLGFLSRTPVRFGLSKSYSSPLSALHMDTHKLSSQEDLALPELQTEFMVDMKCEGCVKSVKSKLETVEGVKNIEVDLSNQVVRILGSTHVKSLEEALEQTGFKARLIGQGVPEDFLISAAVSEFKGPHVFGVVRLAQVSMELARIEANFSGLSPGKHGWSINDFGDLTRGVASTGKLYNPMKQGSDTQPLGDLGTLDANEKGEAFYSGVKPNLKIADLIGRSIAIYNTEDRSDSGVSAAVIARSAGVGENYKKLCTCDGTTIWEATNNDFVSSKV
ncbi:hypothetical protein V2J09_004661 [Rumex salicifolius]